MTAVARLAARANDVADRVWRPGRWVLLAVLVLSFDSVLMLFVTASGSTNALVADIKAGRTHTVRVDSRNQQDVTVRWRTGPLTERSYDYRPDIAQDPVSGLEAITRREAGPAADHVRFEDFDATYGAGGLLTLIPVVYVLFTPSPWLSVAAVLAGLIILLRMLTAREHRWASGPAWALAALVTGAGMFAYLWAESGRTPERRRPGSAAAGAATQRWWRPWLLAVATAAGLDAAGLLVLLADGRL